MQWCLCEVIEILFKTDVFVFALYVKFTVGGETGKVIARKGFTLITLALYASHRASRMSVGMEMQMEKIQKYSLDIGSVIVLKRLVDRQKRNPTNNNWVDIYRAFVSLASSMLCIIFSILHHWTLDIAGVLTVGQTEPAG